MLNLDKLKNPASFSNFDSSQITKFILDHQKHIKVFILLTTLILTAIMFSSYRVQEQNLRNHMAQERGKLGVIKDRQKAIDKLNAFKATLPKEMNIFDLVTLISDDAKMYNVSITSYSPLQGKAKELYSTLEIHFDMVSDNFKDMVLFLRKIEASDLPVIINVWNGHEEDGKVTFTLDIAAVYIHS